jgi:hypothetical protein
MCKLLKSSADRDVAEIEGELMVTLFFARARLGVVVFFGPHPRSQSHPTVSALSFLSNVRWADPSWKLNPTFFGCF